MRRSLFAVKSVYKQILGKQFACAIRSVSQDPSVGGADIDSHDDFKPRFKKTAQQAIKDLQDQLDKEVKSQPIVLFMKGTPDAPECGFSRAIVQVLNSYGFKFYAININTDMLLKEAAKGYADWPTFPQLYLKGEFVGGCDITLNLHKEGTLADMLAQTGAEKQ